MNETNRPRPLAITLAATLVFALPALLPTAADAATFTVTKLADTDDGTCDDDCSLREAIAAANAAGDADTVELTDGLAGTITLSGTGLVVSNPVEVRGPGADILTVSGGGTVRVLFFSAGGGARSHEISGLTIADGYADFGGGVFFAGDADDSLTVDHCHLRDDVATGQGALMVSTGGSVLVRDSAFSSSVPSTAGKAVFMQNTIATFESCTFADIDVGDAVIEVLSLGAAGAAELALRGCTFSGAKPPQAAVGAEQSGAVAGSAVMRYSNSIFAGYDQSFIGSPGSPVLESLGYNISDDATGNLTATGDQPSTDPMLGPLQDNGGPTPTMALLPGSPAIDAGDCAGGALTADQRGVPRPQLGACDVGAFEVAAIFADGFESGDSSAWVHRPPPLPVHRWSFSLDASDSIGDADGVLQGGALVEPGQLVLGGVGEYLELPIAATLASLTSTSVEAWFTVDVLESWARIFDFGTGQAVNFFLTPDAGGSAVLRAAITTGGTGGEQRVDGGLAISAGVPAHVALTLDADADTAVLYVDGARVGSSSWTLDPAALGTLTNLWLGKSQYNDPNLDGSIDEFRIYDRALTSHEVALSHRLGPDHLASRPRTLFATGFEDPPYLSGSPLSGQDGWYADTTAGAVESGVGVGGTQGVETIAPSGLGVGTQSSVRRLVPFDTADFGDAAVRIGIDFMLPAVGASFGGVRFQGLGVIGNATFLTQIVVEAATGAVQGGGPTLAPGTWYRLEIEIDFDAHEARSLVDGVPFASGPIDPGNTALGTLVGAGINSVEVSPSADATAHYDNFSVTTISAP